MDISKMSIIELKAMAFDQVKLLNQTQQNIATIEQAISLKEKESLQDEPKL